MATASDQETVVATNSIPRVDPRTACRSRSAGSRRGFSLIEAIVALTLLTLILGATTSLVVIASRTLEGGVNEVALARAEATMLDLRRDVRLARAIVTRGDRVVEVLVPDRDGDALDERIRWSWSGVSGAPLLRTINGGSPAVVLEDVTEFTFASFVRPTDDADDQSDAGPDAGIVAGGDGAGG